MKTFVVNHLMPSFLVRIFAKPYIAGDSHIEGIEKAKHLFEENGIYSTLDLLGEELKTKEEVNSVVITYLTLIETIKQYKFSSISLKPTSLGVDISKEYCINNIRTILSAALQANILVTLDMESSSYTDVTLDIYRTLKPEFPNFGTVLQTRLFRTKNDILNLKGLKAHIRLCIGIYLERKEIAYTKKDIMKKKLIEYIPLLLDEGHFVAIATHDEKVIYDILKLLEDREGDNSNVEFQMLLGVPREGIQNKLINKGYIVRLYVPFSTKWKYATNYLKRRLIENPHMAIYSIKNIFGMILQRFKRQ